MNPSAVEAADPSVTVGWLAELTLDHPETRVAATLNPIACSDLLTCPTAARMAIVVGFSLVRILKKKIATADGAIVSDTLATGTAIYGDGETDPNQIGAGKVDFGRVDPIKVADVLVSTGIVSGFCISQPALRPRLSSRACGITTFESARSAWPTAPTGEFFG